MVLWLESALGGKTDMRMLIARLPNGEILLAQLTDCKGDREHIGKNVRTAIDDAMRAAAE